MTLDAFLAHLDGVKRNGRGATALCPGHEDHTQSLSVRAGDDGRILANCFAGCPVEQIVGALGLEVRDLFAEPVDAPRRALARLTVADLARAKQLPETLLRARFGLTDLADGRGVAIPYRNAEGRVVATKSRTAVVAKAGSYWPRGRPLVAYVDSSSLARARETGRLVLVEGESDTWTLAAHGIPVLGLPGATATATLTAEHLDGVRELYACQEADAAGARFVAGVRDRLRALGYTGRAVVVTMPAGCKDVNDLHRRDPAGFVPAFQAAAKAAQPLETTAARDASEATPVPAEPDGPVLRGLDPAAMRPIEWARPGRWPKGYLVLVVGDPGLGKSLLTLDAAARFSTGAPWPEGGTAPQGRVIILSAEDGAADVLTPRLVAAGADLSRVKLLEAVRVGGRERGFSLAADLDRLEAAITQHRPVAVIVDPLAAYLGRDVDSKTDADVRGILGPLARLADQYRVVILLVAHLNKSTAKALYRTGGSIGFVGAARSVFAVVPDPDAPDPQAPGARRFFAPVKLNYAAHPPALAFRTEPATVSAPHGPIATVRLAWDTQPVGRVDLDRAMGAMAADAEAQEERTDAAAWLSHLLADARVPVKVIEAEAKAAAVGSWRTIESAKRKLRVKAERVGAAGAGGFWTWRLPETPREAAIRPEPKAATGAADAA